jgi:hypothetical protein
MGFDKKKLQITKATFDDAFDLQDAISRAVKGNRLNVPEGMESDIDVSSFLDAALSTISSRDVRDCLFRCAERALYDNQKINKDFFEKEDNRELYYPIMIEIVKENVGPFITGLLSSFGGPGQIETFLKRK